MDIEFIEHHHRFFLRVVERPLLRLTVGRNVCAERRIASLGKLYPHLAHSLAEGLVERSSRVGSHLGMIEYDCQFDGMSAFHDGVGRLGRKVIGECFTTSLCLALRQLYDRHIKPALAQKAAVGLEVITLHIVHKAIDQCFLVSWQLGIFLLLATCNPLVPAFLAETGNEEVHFILVATYQNLQILRCAVSVGCKGIGGQILPVSFG